MWCVHLHLKVRVHQACSHLRWHTFAHKEAEGLLVAISSQQIIPDAPTASTRLGCLRIANSKFACRAWENDTRANPASPPVTQALKLLCLCLEPQEVPLRVLPTSGHILPGMFPSSWWKAAASLWPSNTGPQAQRKGLSGKQMLVHPPYLPPSHNKTFWAWEGAEEREVLSTVKASRPQLGLPKCHATQAILFMPQRTWGSFWEGT